MLMVSGRWWPGMLLKVPQCTGQPRVTWAKTSAGPRWRNLPSLELDSKVWAQCCTDSAVFVNGLMKRESIRERFLRVDTEVI